MPSATGWAFAIVVLASGCAGPAAPPSPAPAGSARGARRDVFRSALASADAALATRDVDSALARLAEAEAAYRGAGEAWPEDQAIRSLSELASRYGQVGRCIKAPPPELERDPGSDLMAPPIERRRRRSVCSALVPAYNAGVVAAEAGRHDEANRHFARALDVIAWTPYGLPWIAPYERACRLWIECLGLAARRGP